MTRSGTEIGEYATFHERMKAALGVESVRAFSRRTKIPASSLRQYLSGVSEPTRPVLVSIAEALDVDVAWLGAGVRRPDRDSASEAREAALAYGGANETLRLEDVPLALIVGWLRDWWARATPDQRTWMRVQLERTFPELVEWEKKLEPSLLKQSGA